MKKLNNYKLYNILSLNFIKLYVFLEVQQCFRVELKWIKFVDLIFTDINKLKCILQLIRLVGVFII